MKILNRMEVHAVTQNGIIYNHERGEFICNGKRFCFDSCRKSIAPVTQTVVCMEYDDFNGGLDDAAHPVQITDADIATGFTEFLPVKNPGNDIERVCKIEVEYYDTVFDEYCTEIVSQKVIESANAALDKCKEDAMRDNCTKQHVTTDIETEWSGYGNGHCTYCIIGVEKERAKDILRTESQLRVPIGGLKFSQKNGKTIATFDTCEKDLSDLSKAILTDMGREFPDCTCVAVGEWDFPTLMVYTPNKGFLNPFYEQLQDLFDISLDECFFEDGNLRLDVKLTDKATGEDIYVGDLICDDVDSILSNDVYSSLTDMLSPKDCTSVLKTVLKYRNKYIDVKEGANNER